MLNQSEQSRKKFAVFVTVIIGCLTLVSLGASYSVYLESFRDWPTIGPVFAFLVTAGIEIAFAALIYGLMKALIGGEVPVAGIGAAALLVVMAVNFVVHSRTVRGVHLEDWQAAWQN